MQAERERDITVEHLADIDRLVNESLQMLSRFQDLNTKILPLMEDYLIALRSRDNTPASLLRMDKNHEEEMINNYTSDMKAKIQGNFYTIKRQLHGPQGPNLNFNVLCTELNMDKWLTKYNVNQ